MKSVPATKTRWCSEPTFPTSPRQQICAADQNGPLATSSGRAHFCQQPRVAGLTVKQLVAAPSDDPSRTFAFLLSTAPPSRICRAPILVVEFEDQPGAFFRVVPSRCRRGEQPLARQHATSFADAVDAHGIFSGFPITWTAGRISSRIVKGKLFILSALLLVATCEVACFHLPIMDSVCLHAALVFVALLCHGGLLFSQEPAIGFSALLRRGRRRRGRRQRVRCLPFVRVPTAAGDKLNASARPRAGRRPWPVLLWINRHGRGPISGCGARRGFISAHSPFTLQQRRREIDRQRQDHGVEPNESIPCSNASRRMLRPVIATSETWPVAPMTKLK